jgi:sodium-dependent dicarboxylate transporter 2/3/5
LAFPTDPALTSIRSDWVKEQRAALGSWKRGEINVMVAFLTTVFFWLLPGILSLALGKKSEVVEWFDTHMPEATVALLGALLLFMLPIQGRPFRATITWKEATRIDWGTILLFGGGLALGNLMFQTGLAEWIGHGLAEAFAANSQLGLTILFTGVAILVSETTSNSASATMVVPVAIAVARAAGVETLPVALAACLGASMGFMLPVSTPPNAIVYGSGCIPITKMIRYGLLLDVMGFLVIIVTVNWWLPWVVSPAL